MKKHDGNKRLEMLCQFQQRQGRAQIGVPHNANAKQQKNMTGTKMASEPLTER